VSVILPTFPGPAGADPYFLDAGGVQRGLAGGEDMRLDRLGDRFGLTVTLAPMRWNGLTNAQRVDAARVWVARLIQGKSVGAVFPMPQPDFTPPGNKTTVATAAVSGASQVNVTNTGAAVTLLEGQFLEHTRAATGRQYLYQVRADTTLPANAAAILPLWPRIRGPMAVGDDVELKAPTIEGLVIGDQLAWSLAINRLATMSFRIEERG
jgi:hypothetical protein